MNSPLLNVMTAAATKAGKGLVRDFGEVDQLHVSKKGAGNFVTESDVRTEKLLCRELSKARPDFGYLLEEGGEVAGKDVAHRFIIDPLDGTTNFIHAIPYFCISIALERRDHKTSEIIAGVIFDPIHNELFTAEKNKGAFLNGRRLVVSSRDKFENAMIAGSTSRPPHEHKDHAVKVFDTLHKSGVGLRNFGAAALDLANLAAGRLDACWYYHIQPWDIAAGMLMVHEAGGVVNNLSGQPATAYSPTLLAANQPLSSALGSLLAKAA